MKTRYIELLAPAKNLEIGKAAIDHGADAVYIGAPRFGARAAAGNSLEDIAELTAYAHIYGARIYVTVNTILRDDELKDTEMMIWVLYRIGVDALIVQDMALMRMNLPPIPLHASTQMDNRTPAKVKFLAQAGFRQVVLARELSLKEIRAIHAEVPDVALEVFVHGALCVSYSGQCYVSQHCYGRSANRGECAQFCRLAFDLVDADGKAIARGKHLLSLKDLNQSDRLEQLLDAGATSLKIEGRLKDLTYVKNVTAYYRQALDALFKRRPEYAAASQGRVEFTFRPQLNKSFSRGFTHYFLDGRVPAISSPDTPKSLGEEMGTVKELRGNCLIVAGVKPWNNGDGACFINEQGRMEGFRVNRVDSNKLYPQEMPQVRPRTVLYRNFDQEFERLLSRPSAERRIPVDITLSENAFGFTLTMDDGAGHRICLPRPMTKEPARTPQTDNLRTQLGKLGNTPFEARSIEVNLSGNWFIPSSQLADLRRGAVDALLAERRIRYPRELQRMQSTTHSYGVQSLSYLGNVMNREAAAFYRDHGVERIAPAYELKPAPDAVLMQCKHCIRYALGGCPVHHQNKLPYREPYSLVSSDGRRFRLHFDCKNCQMKIFAE